jgi:preprotein translocase subunit SecA
VAISKQKVLTKVFGDPQKRILKGLEKKVGAINAREDKYKKMTKPELRKQTEVLKKTLGEKRRQTRRFAARRLCAGA